MNQWVILKQASIKHGYTFGELDRITGAATFFREWKYGDPKDHVQRSCNKPLFIGTEQEVRKRIKLIEAEITRHKREIAALNELHTNRIRWINDAPAA